MAGVGYSHLEALVGGGVDDIRLTDPLTGAGLFTTNTDPNVVGIDPLTGLDSPAGTDMGFGSALRRMIQTGLYNSDFSLPPQDTSKPINSDTSSADYNPLPYWRLQDDSNGAITVWWVEDATAPGGGRIRFDVVAGASSDEAYLEQLAPVVGSTGRSYAADLWSTWVAGTSNALGIFARAQFLRRDAVTTTGSEIAPTTTWSIVVSNSPYTYPSEAGYSGGYTVPADAGYQRVRIGVWRNGASAALAGSMYLAEAFVTIGHISHSLVDVTAPSNPTGRLFKSGGFSILDNSTSGAGRLTMSDDGSSLSGHIALNNYEFASITANQDDYNPGGWDTCSVLILDPNAARNITGFDAPSDSKQGRVKWIYNIDDTFSITLVHASGSSSANNQIYGPNNADIVLRPRGGVMLMWIGDVGGSAIRWRCLSER